MATFDQVLKLLITADGRGLSAGLTKATGELKNFGATAQRNLQVVANGFRSLGAFAGVSLAGLGTREILATADSYSLLEARIKGITAETNDYAAVSAQLRDIAKSTGTELDATVTVFQSLARTRGDLGATNAQMLQLTRLVQQLGVLGGASTSALQNGLLQFSQAMGEGIVRAEEFNSILTNLPELAKAIRDGLGKSNAELRQMVKSGQLLSKDVFDALIKQSGAIEERFAKVPTTLARGWGALKIELIDLVGRLNESLGLTEAIGRAAQAAADLLKPSREDVLEDLKEQEEELQRLIYLRDAWERKRAAAPFTSINPFVDTKDDIGKILDRNLQSIMKTEAEIGRLNVQLIGMQQAGELAVDATGAMADGVAKIGEASANAAKEISALQKTYATLVKEIKDGAKAAAAGPVKDVKQSTVLDINRLRDQADDLIRRGDADSLASAEKLISRAREINDYLLESKQITGTYYQTQADRLLELAQLGETAAANPVVIPVEADTTGVAQGIATELQLQQEFLNQNPLVVRTVFAPGSYDLTNASRPTTPEGVNSFASGGLISGPGTATSDSVLARLSAGEFVVKAAAVRNYGAAFLEKLNQLKLPKFSLGGLVPSPALPQVIMQQVPAFAAGGPVGTPVNIVLPGGQSFGLSAQPSVAKQLSAILSTEVLKRGRR